MSITRSNNWRISKWFPDIDPDAVRKLKLFHDELLKFNPKINLISRKTESDADLIHFADCIMACKLMLQNNQADRILDIGSGNGFPGLVLAAMAPERMVILLDKDVRKIEFLKHAASKMGLANVRTFNGLLESFTSEQFQCAISRGFASLSGSLIPARNVIAKGGEYYHMKSTGWVREIAEIPTQICSFWSPKLVGDYSLPSTKISLSLVVAKRIG